jgi:hypothetical protein
MGRRLSQCLINAQTGQSSEVILYMSGNPTLLKADWFSVPHWQNKTIFRTWAAHFEKREALALDALTNEVYTTPAADGARGPVPPSK